MKRTISNILLTLIIIAVTGCTEEGKNSLPAPPVIILDNESSIYVTKAGREIVISPTYENSENSLFSWMLDETEICNEPSLHFTEEETGRYFVTLKVSNDGGSDEEELRIDVMELTPPRITIPGAEEGFVILLGSELEIEPDISSPLETTFRWILDGREVSTDSVYLFSGDKKGKYSMRVEAANEDGEDAMDFTIEVRTSEEMDFSWSFEQTTYNLSKNRRVRLRAVDIENAFNATYIWSVDGEKVQEGSEPEYIFSSGEEGTFSVKLEMHNGSFMASQELTVNVFPEEGRYYRPGGSGNSHLCNKVYEFLPAPGQFVNEYYTAANMEEACKYAEERMAQTAYVSLGGFGGYITVGFDHSIDNDGDWNIAVTGNAFDGSSEPGIIWVMQDENGNGMPDDTWYELKGSEYGKAETDQDYAVTYYRPSAPGMSVSWRDNRGESGTVEYLGAFHKQDYYYPAWVESDTYILRGTCLKARNYDQSGNGTYWVNPHYDWGYADNFSPTDRLTENDNYNAAPADNHFKISNAVTFDGQPANLRYIDFVKIQVGVNAKSGWLGELSTEVFGVKDFNMLKQK